MTHHPAIPRLTPRCPFLAGTLTLPWTLNPLSHSRPALFPAAAWHALATVHAMQNKLGVYLALVSCGVIDDRIVDAPAVLGRG